MYFLGLKRLKDYSILVSIIKEDKTIEHKPEIHPNCFYSKSEEHVKYCLSVIDLLYRLPKFHKFFNMIGRWMGKEG